MGRQLAKAGSTDAVSGSRKITYRLGLYDPLDESGDVDFIDEDFGDSSQDLQDMQAAIAEYGRWSVTQPHVTQCLGVFAVENSHALT